MCWGGWAVTSEDPLRRVLRELGRALRALRAYVPRVIVIGGIVPILYRHHEWFGESRVPALTTTEGDLAVPMKLEIVDGQTVVGLLDAAGFVIYEVPGFDNLPGTQRVQDREAGAQKPAPTYLEFLAPMFGKPEPSLVQLQPGLRAQRLRHLDLLAHETLWIDARRVPDLEVEEALEVRIPNPATYVLQKVLARKERVAAKRPKDMAYAFDVAMLSRPSWGSLAGVLQRAGNSDANWKASIAKARERIRTLFDGEHSDGVIEAARVYRDFCGDAAPSEKTIHEVMRRFIDQLG